MLRRASGLAGSGVPGAGRGCNLLRALQCAPPRLCGRDMGVTNVIRWDWRCRPPSAEQSHRARTFATRSKDHHEYARHQCAAAEILTNTVPNCPMCGEIISIKVCHRPRLPCCPRLPCSCAIFVCLAACSTTVGSPSAAASARYLLRGQDREVTRLQQLATSNSDLVVVVVCSFPPNSRTPHPEHRRRDWPRSGGRTLTLR